MDKYVYIIFSSSNQKHINMKDTNTIKGVFNDLNKAKQIAYHLTYNEDNKEINTIVVRYNEGLFLDTFSTININHVIIAGYKCNNNVCEYSLNIPYL